MWAASAASNLSDGLHLAAAPLLAATLTRDPVLVSGVALAFTLPWLLFSLISGALVDRLDRRVAMGVCNVVRAALIGGLGMAVLLDLHTLPMLYGVFFLLGTNETLYDNAAQAIVPTLVRRDQLERANSRLYAAQLVNNQFAGPPLGSFLFAAVAAAPFLLGAGAYAAAAALMLALKGGYRPRREAGAPPTTIVAEIREGLSWLYAHRLLRLLAGILGVMNMIFMAGQAILVLYVLEVLGLAEVWYGVLITCTAVGGVAASVLGDRVIPVLGSGRTLFFCALLSAGSSAVIALAISPWVVAAMFVVEGVSMVLWNVVTVSLRQAIVPERLFGRVNSVYRLLGWGSIPVGALLGGLLAREISLTAPFWAAAGVLVVVSAVIYGYINDQTIADARAAAAQPEENAL